MYRKLLILIFVFSLLFSIASATDITKLVYDPPNYVVFDPIDSNYTYFINKTVLLTIAEVNETCVNFNTTWYCGVTSSSTT
jgi:hypothetical protein